MTSRGCACDWCFRIFVLPVVICVRFFPSWLRSIRFDSFAWSGSKDIDEGGRLPLHFACEHSAPVEAVGLLIAAYPDGDADQ
jgi:hypothetical protein